MSEDEESGRNGRSPSADYGWAPEDGSVGTYRLAVVYTPHFEAQMYVNSRSCGIAK
jgi:hypothetical protein